MRISLNLLQVTKLLLGNDRKYVKDTGHKPSIKPLPSPLSDTVGLWLVSLFDLLHYDTGTRLGNWSWLIKLQIHPSII